MIDSEGQAANGSWGQASLKTRQRYEGFLSSDLRPPTSPIGDYAFRSRDANRAQAAGHHSRRYRQGRTYETYRPTYHRLLHGSLCMACMEP